VATREGREPDSDNGGRRLVIKEAPRTAAVEPNEVPRQLARVIAGDAGLTRFAEPCGHPVDGLATLDPAVQRGDGRTYPADDAGRRIEQRPRCAARERQDVLDG
jgi:hypothetical protein